MKNYNKKSSENMSAYTNNVLLKAQAKNSAFVGNLKKGDKLKVIYKI
jgi:hypothetical protein